jgi:DNA-binding NarL/FixJ family response regulator
VLAGGQALVRAARRSVLGRGGLDVVGEAAYVAPAAEVAAQQGAGAVLVDSDIPGGLVPAIQRIGERAPTAAVVVLAPELDYSSLIAALLAGASGFLPETLPTAGLVRAVEAALQGEIVIPRAGIGMLVDEVRGVTRRQTLVDGVALQLTRREADVMTRRRAGMTPKQIAAELDLSAVTVRRHLSSVARKSRQARPQRALESTS